MRTLKYFAAAGAVSVVLAGASLPAVAADRVISGNDRDIAAESVDVNEPISLMVRKAPTNPFDDIPAGQKPPAVAGAKFTLSKVRGVDITTTEGRSAARNMSLADARATGLRTISTLTTGEDGQVQFMDLQPGLYLLEESAPDSNYDYPDLQPEVVDPTAGQRNGRPLQVRQRDRDQAGQQPPGWLDLPGDAHHHCDHDTDGTPGNTEDTFGAGGANPHGDLVNGEDHN